MDDETQKKNKRLEKKRRLKERFDAEYDDGDATYFDDLKEEMQIQAEVWLLSVRGADTPPLVTWHTEQYPIVPRTLLIQSLLLTLRTGPKAFH